VVQAQEQDPYIPIDIPAQNLLKFNRFLLNPTFSTVREDKSYLNLYHRNQNIQFDNTFNTYLLSYSGRIGDRSGVGLSLYSQKAGTITNYGVMANYAYGLKLNDKSNFTFGFNMS
jgi:type IX secretion system PorP/SprF family membrane protein